MIKQFKDFQKTFKGDPRSEVQRLLNSGQMTQAQYNELQSMAQQLMGFMK
jgi:vancomycin permeability regulator SanA